jgi:hypothetical protein
MKYVLLALAVVLAGTTTAFALIGYQTLASYKTQSSAYQLGYAAGVHDAVQDVADDVNNGVDMKVYVKIARCLGRFQTVGALRDWAVKIEAPGNRQMANAMNVECSR